MGMLTSARVEIAAPAADVFSWLVDPVRLTAWAGGPGGMPEDGSVLRAGWTSTFDNPPIGPMTLEVIVYEPPTRLEYRTTYPGGDSFATFLLSEGEGATTLVMEGDTDWARPEGTEGEAVDAALEGQAAGTQALMQQAAEASVRKLKVLIESAI